MPRFRLHAELHPATVQIDQVSRFLLSVRAFIYLLMFPSHCKQTGKKQITVLKSINKTVNRSYRTLARYVQDGAKFCLLAGGGTHIPIGYHALH